MTNKTTLTAAALTTAVLAAAALTTPRELTPPPPLASPLCWLDAGRLHCAANIGEAIPITTTNQTYTATVGQAGLAIYTPTIQAGQTLTIAAIPPLTIPAISTWRAGAGLATYTNTIQAGQTLTIAAIPPLTIPIISTWRAGAGLAISTPITSTLIYYQHTGQPIAAILTTPITPGLTIATIPNPHPADRAIVEAHLPGLILRVPARIHASYFPIVHR